MLGRLLSERLGLPIISRDSLKAGAAISTAVTRDESGRPSVAPGVIAQDGPAGRAGFAALMDIGRSCLAHGVSFGVEQAWSRSHSVEDLRALIATSRAVLIHCTIARSLAIERYAARLGNDGGRFAPDDAVIAAMRSGAFPWQDYEQPIDLGIPVLLVDTTAGYEPGLDEIEAFIWAATMG